MAEIKNDPPRWREWLSEKLNPAQPSIASLEPYASPETIVDFEQAYREIEIIHRAVEMVIAACVDTPLKVTGQTPAKKVNKLLNIRPNPFEDRVRFFRRALLDFHLDGNAFFYYDGNDLYLLPANDVEVVPDPHTFVNHYNYLVSNQQSSDFFGYNKQTRKSEAIRFEPHEIIHITSENTTSIFRGTSKLKPLLRLIELYYYMINFQRQFFKNNAIPGFVLTTDNILSKRVKERLLEGWRNSYTTIFDNARHPAILDGGLKIDQFSQVKFQELDFENSIERIQQDMAKALGVPYVLLKSGNNANIDANQKLFYQHTVMPILNQFCSAFMLFFNNGVQIKPDKLTIPALRPDERTQSIYYSTLVNTGIITPNEARVGLGFPSIDGEDSIRVPQNITGSATDATQGADLPMKSLKTKSKKEQAMKDKMLFISSEIEKASLSKQDKNLKIAGYANTTAKDRAGDIVTADAWAKGVDNFRRNPVLLYQHKHDCPIGKVNKITVDKKGIFVEAAVSKAAEDNHGIQTLIKDGALKSFSVGFKVKDGKYNRDEDSMYITDVELLEISVVSVPCNQDSLFSVRKSFETDDDYSKFVESFKSEESTTKEEKAAKIKAGITDLADGHYHTVEMDKKGDGVTTYASHMANHAHKIKDGVLEAADGHTHEISMVGVAVHDSVGPDSDADVSTRPLSPSEQESANGDSAPKVHAEGQGQVLPVAEASSEDLEIEIKNEEESLEIEGKEEEDEEDFDLDPNTPIPFLNLLSTEASQISNGNFVKYDNVRYKVTKIATAQSPTFKFLEVDLQGKDCDNSVDVDADNIFVVNTWDIGSKFDIIVEDFGEISETLQEDFNKYCNASEADLYKFKDSSDLNPQEQEKLNTLINIKLTPSSEWNDIEQKFAHVYTQKIKALLELNTSEAQEDSNISLALKLHGYFKKENDTMAEQVVDTIDLSNAGAEKIEQTTEQVIEEKAAPVAQVSEPEVAKLVEKTGEAVMKESDAAERAQETGASYKREIEELAELKAQISKYKDEVKSLTETKMVFQENQRSSQQFSEKEMANAFLLAKCMNKADPFDTQLGNRMKAITSVDQFLSNFSSNIYTEMEQQLVIAPMFNRIAVDAKNFRVPVADEDTDGDVAQFASGTFATGVGDTTNVPTSNQNTISAVTFTPHKFMATTHLAKDEEEDTVLPLLDFLRAAATRRLARAIDKTILRGRGNLTGFTAAPTNAITAGTGYAAVLKGITTLANDASLTATTGSASDKVDPTDIASARGSLGKYGLQLGDQLVYLTTIEGYNNLVTTSDFRTVDKFGPNATYLTGSVGAVYGIPIQITEFLDVVGGSGRQIGALVYKPGFMIAERRGMEIESEYEPRQQVTAMYLSTRFDFKALTTNSSAALDATKYSYAVQVKTG